MRGDVLALLVTTEHVSQIVDIERVGKRAGKMKKEMIEEMFASKKQFKKWKKKSNWTMMM